MGHLSPHRELLEELLRRGHEVHAAARHVGRAARAFEGLGLRLWQAPMTQDKPEPVYDPTPTMAEVLHNAGFDRADYVRGRLLAWQQILDAVRPELVLADYAPTLLLALHGLGVPTVLLGTGFFVPPPGPELPVYATLATRHANHGRAVERAQLGRLNELLAERGRPALGSLSELFNARSVHPVLQTLPELDHFPEREGGTYVGVPAPPDRGLPPRWPPGRGKPIFAYLKNSKAIEQVVGELLALGSPLLLVSDGIPAEVRQRFRAPHLRVEAEAVNLRLALPECAAVVSNGNHGTVAQGLLAGVPQLCLPIFLEQSLLSHRVGRHGAGMVGDPRVGKGLTEGLRRILGEPRFADAARRFAERNRSFDPSGQVARTLAAVERVVPL
jgi:UDP:flavonoid glycosyltransferase YjiC (YdhE family)